MSHWGLAIVLCFGLLGAGLLIDLLLDWIASHWPTSS